MCFSHRTCSLVYVTDWMVVNFNNMFLVNHNSCYHSMFSCTIPVINITCCKCKGQIILMLKQYVINVCEAVDVGLLKKTEQQQEIKVSSLRLRQL